MAEKKKRNWKTTIIGIAMLLVAVGGAAVALLDGDPETTVDIAVFAGAVEAALAAGGFIAAKDGDK